GAPEGDPTSTESAMFAPIPSWERNKKRRGKAAGERRSFFSEEPADAAMTGATAGAATGAMASDTAFAETPTYAERRTTRTTRRGGSAAPIAIAAGLIVL